MKLMSYNIQYGKGKDGRFDLERISGEIGTADVVALQEVERFWKRSGMRDEPAELGELLPEYHWVYGANLDVDASYRDDQNHLINRRRQHGTMILSRPPILSSRNFPLPKYGTLNQHSIQQGALEAVIETPAGAIRVYSLHLHHIVSEVRMMQLEALLEVHRRAPMEGGAWSGKHPNSEEGWTEGKMPPMPREAVLMGDFNFTPDQAEYDLLVGPRDPKYGRLNNLDGFVDAWVAAGNPENGGPTSLPYGKERENKYRRIDYCFVSTSLAHRVRAAKVGVNAQGSDHQPLLVEIDLNRNGNFG